MEASRPSCDVIRTLLQCTLAKVIAEDRTVDISLHLEPLDGSCNGQVFVDFFNGAVSCSNSSMESVCYEDNGGHCADCGGVRKKTETMISVVVRAKDVRCDCELWGGLSTSKRDAEEVVVGVLPGHGQTGGRLEMELKPEAASQTEIDCEEEQCTDQGGNSLTSVHSGRNHIDELTNNNLAISQPIDRNTICNVNVRPRRSHRRYTRSKVGQMAENAPEETLTTAECSSLTTEKARKRRAIATNKHVSNSDICDDDNRLNKEDGKLVEIATRQRKVDGRLRQKACVGCGSMYECMCERNFCCDLCDKVFSHTSNLRQHMASHSNARPFICHQCGNMFKTRTNLATHRARHSTPYRCGECDRAFSLSTALKYHMRQHTGEKPFQCDTCGTTYPSSTALKAHVRRHESKPFQFPCDICAKTFKHRSHLDTHLRIHQGIRPFPCSFCSRTFASKSHMSKHIRQHTKDKPFKCEYCPKGFFSRPQLEEHHAKHTGEKKYVCLVCGNKFVSASSLKDHMLLHSAVKPFQCHVCRKEFAAMKSLKKHVQIHNTENPLVCEFCGKSCPAPRYLKSHMMTHTGYTKHKCDLCGKSYRDQRYLKIHIKCHTGEGLLQCDECGHKFADPTYLKLHQKKYCKSTREQCHICGRGFGLKKDLEMHLGTHSGQRPYACVACGRAYVTADALAEHAKRHNWEEKSHQCTVCLKGFYSSSDLQKHIRRTKCLGKSKQDTIISMKSPAVHHISDSGGAAEAAVDESRTMTQWIPVVSNNQLQTSPDPVAGVAGRLLATIDSPDGTTASARVLTTIDLDANQEAIESTYTVYDLEPTGRQLQK